MPADKLKISSRISLRRALREIIASDGVDIRNECSRISFVAGVIFGVLDMCELADEDKMDDTIDACAALIHTFNQNAENPRSQAQIRQEFADSLEMFSSLSILDNPETVH